MKTIYRGIRTFVDKDTGETYKVADIKKIVNFESFVKVHFADFLMSIGLFGGKSEHVYMFVLDHLSFRSNKLKMTNAQIKKNMAKEGHNVSMATIKRALAKLKNTKDSHGHPLIKRKRYGKYGRRSYIMLDPDIARIGKQKHHANLMIQYASDNSKKKPRKADIKRTSKARKVREKQMSMFPDRKNYGAHKSSLYKKGITKKHKKAE